MKTKLCSTAVSSLGERKMSFTISTADTDREGDSINPKGWSTANYMAAGSGVVLYGHDHSQLPIAKATHVWADSGGLHATVEFPPRGMYEFSDQVHDMVKAGFLNATSVGFLPLESRPNRTGGKDILRAELLEFSIVAVPANPYALVTQRSGNRSAMLKWLGTFDDVIDGVASNRSEELEIDWASINRSLESCVEVNVTSEDVRRVVNYHMPAMKEGLRAGLRLQAQLVAEAAIRRLTGRVD